MCVQSPSPPAGPPRRRPGEAGDGETARVAAARPPASRPDQARGGGATPWGSRPRNRPRRSPGGLDVGAPAIDRRTSESGFVEPRAVWSPTSAPRFGDRRPGSLRPRAVRPPPGSAMAGKRRPNPPRQAKPRREEPPPPPARCRWSLIRSPTPGPGNPPAATRGAARPPATGMRSRGRPAVRIATLAEGPGGGVPLGVAAQSFRRRNSACEAAAAARKATAGASPPTGTLWARRPGGPRRGVL